MYLVRVKELVALSIRVAIDNAAPTRLYHATLPSSKIQFGKQIAKLFIIGAPGSIWRR
jgi:hypothetical protein